MVTGHYIIFCLYCEAALSSSLKHTLWANVSLQWATLTFTGNLDNRANVACQWETLAQQVYIKKKKKPCKQKVYFFVCCLVRVSCPSTAINWRSTCIVSLEIHQNVEKVGQSIYKCWNDGIVTNIESFGLLHHLVLVGSCIIILFMLNLNYISIQKH